MNSAAPYRFIRFGTIALLLLWLPTLPTCAQAISAEFTTQVIRTGGDPDAVIVADVNHDGIPDIIAANPSSGTVTALLGEGENHFHPAPGSPFPAGHLPADIGIGDFDGDGNLDLVIPNHQTPFITLLLGDGKGGFHPAPHSPFATRSTPHPHGVAVGHFCGNDKPLDIVIDSWGSRQVELLLGDGKGNFTNGPMFPAGPGSDLPLRSVDFNHDGNLDIVMPDTAIGEWNSNKVSVLLGDGKCGFKAAPGSPFTAGDVPWSLAVGDLNKDGNPDFVILPYGTQVRDPHHIAATVLLGDGKGGFVQMSGSPFALPDCASPRRAAIGELGKSRTQSFVVTCTGINNILLFRGDNKGHLQSIPIVLAEDSPAAPSLERNVTFAHLTNHSTGDIIITNGAAGTITLLLSR
jgi:hypothetical protein